MASARPSGAARCSKPQHSQRRLTLHARVRSADSSCVWLHWRRTGGQAPTKRASHPHSVSAVCLRDCLPNNPAVGWCHSITLCRDKGKALGSPRRACCTHALSVCGVTCHALAGTAAAQLAAARPQHRHSSQCHAASPAFPVRAPTQFNRPDHSFPPSFPLAFLSTRHPPTRPCVQGACHVVGRA